MSERDPNAEKARRDALFEKKMGSVMLRAYTLEEKAERLGIASVWADDRLEFERNAAAFLQKLEALRSFRSTVPLHLLRSVAARALVQPKGVTLKELVPLRKQIELGGVGEAVRRLLELQVLEIVPDEYAKGQVFRPTQLCMLTILDRPDQAHFILESVKEHDPQFVAKDLLPFVEHHEILDLSPLA